MIYFLLSNLYNVDKVLCKERKLKKEKFFFENNKYNGCERGVKKRSKIIFLIRHLYLKI
jgi:hypothetical protein